MSARQSARTLLTFSSSGRSASRVDHLRGGVWEIRTSLANRIARTLFAVEGRQMVLLHGFIKKTQQTPNDDIKLAEKRFKEWQRGET
jgi:phage-related protein